MCRLLGTLWLLLLLLAHSCVETRMCFYWSEEAHANQPVPPDTRQTSTNKLPSIVQIKTRRKSRDYRDYYYIKIFNKVSVHFIAN